MICIKTRTIGLLLLCLIPLALDSRGHKAAYIDGVKLGQEGKFGEAKTKMLRALEIDPLNIPAKRAVDLLEDIEQKKVGTVTARYLFDGMIHFVNLEWEKAGIAYKKALDTAPDYYYTCNNYTSTLTRPEDAEKRIFYLEKSVSLNPDYPHSHYNLGIAYAGQKMYDKAAAEYEKTISLAPWYYKAYNNMGVMLVKQGKKKEAPPWFAEAVRINPDYDLAFNYLLGVFVENLDLMETLIPVYQNVLREKPGALFAYKKLGIIYWYTGRWKDARELIEKLEQYCAETKNEKN
jgi:tetratricopeptide (TPR) repeat protein